MEYRFYPVGQMPPVSTFEFHEHRERAPHLEQPIHRDRLLKAAQFVEEAAGLWLATHPDLVDSRMPADLRRVYVSDLGCGDGGLLQLLDDDPNIAAWGYDFAPANESGWFERGVSAEAIDVFNDLSNTAIEIGDIAVMTEVLEHLADPHGVIRWLGENPGADYLVCSSPWTETPAQHDECHAWAWDIEGYRTLIEQGGYRILRQEKVSWFQVVLAWKSVAPKGSG